MLDGQDRAYLPHAFPSALPLYVTYTAVLSSALLFGSIRISKIIAKDEQLARLQLARHLCHKHARCSMSFLLIDRHIQCVAAADRFEPAISCSADVLGEGMGRCF